MATKNTNDNSTSRNADTVICESLKVIKNDKKTAASLHTANSILKKSKKAARRYKVCSLDKAQESQGVYEDIMSCVTVGSSKKIEIIQKNVNEYFKKDDEIDKLIKESSKLLNEMRLKIEDAHNAACAMSNCFENKILPKTGKSTKDGEKADVHKDLHKILQKTKELNEKGQNAFDSSVTIAGIQTFTNTHSLKDFMAKLTTAMGTFRSTVEQNITSTTGDVTVCRDELNVIEEELAQVVCDKNLEAVKHQGLGDVINYVCKGKYNDDLLDLCRETRDCYDGDHENYDERKKGRLQTRQSIDRD